MIKNDRILNVNQYCRSHHSVLPPGEIFVSSARQGATAKLQEPGWGHIQGVEMILGSQAGGTALL